jgi:K+/H+ antiporter YhaU regulatory subunit KhtT
MDVPGDLLRLRREAKEKQIQVQSLNDECARQMSSLLADRTTQVRPFDRAG